MCAAMLFVSLCVLARALVCMSLDVCRRVATVPVFRLNVSAELGALSGAPPQLHGAPHLTQGLSPPLPVIEVPPLCPAPTRNIGHCWQRKGSRLKCSFVEFNLFLGSGYERPVSFAPLLFE